MKTYTLQDFKDGKVVLRNTDKELMRKICAASGKINESVKPLYFAKYYFVVTAGMSVAHKYRHMNAVSGSDSEIPGLPTINAEDLKFTIEDFKRGDIILQRTDKSLTAKIVNFATADFYKRAGNAAHGGAEQYFMQSSGDWQSSNTVGKMPDLIHVRDVDLITQEKTIYAFVAETCRESFGDYITRKVREEQAFGSDSLDVLKTIQELRTELDRVNASNLATNNAYLKLQSQASELKNRVAEQADVINGFHKTSVHDKVKVQELERDLRAAKYKLTDKDSQIAVLRAKIEVLSNRENFASKEDYGKLLVEVQNLKIDKERAERSNAAWRKAAKDAANDAKQSHALNEELTIAIIRAGVSHKIARELFNM